MVGLGQLFLAHSPVQLGCLRLSHCKAIPGRMASVFMYANVWLSGNCFHPGVGL